MKRLVPVLLCTFLLTGCLQTIVTVSVRNDGSGSIREEVLMRQDAFRMYQDLARMNPDLDHFSLMNSEFLRSQAAEMGNGVSFVSAKEVENEEGAGFSTEYSFLRIEELEISQNPVRYLPKNDLVSQESYDSRHNITFAFERDDLCHLNIVFPDSQPVLDPFGQDLSGGTGSGDGYSSEGEMLRELYRDMIFCLYLDIHGDIVWTDASYVKDSRITLMEIYFNNYLRKLEQSGQELGSGPSHGSLKNQMAGVPDIRLELKDLVHVVFK